MAQDDNPGRQLGFAEPAVVFKGPTQTARSVTEAWVALHGFQPNDPLFPQPEKAPGLWPPARSPCHRYPNMGVRHG